MNQVFKYEVERVHSWYAKGHNRRLRFLSKYDYASSHFKAGYFKPSSAHSIPRDRLKSLLSIDRQQIMDTTRPDDTTPGEYIRSPVQI